MNQENIDDEIIDVKPIFNMIKEGFKNLLRLFISIILFFRKKALLFIAVLVIGVIGGYFLDKYVINDNYIQEIIVKPNYDSTIYVYDFIESFNDNFRNKDFIKTHNINENQIKNLANISIEPVFQYTDILDYFNNEYGEKDAHHMISEINPKELKEEKYRKFYKFHKISLYFNGKTDDSKSVSKLILEALKANLYFKDILKFEIEKIHKEIAENERTLSFVNKYLDKIIEESSERQDSDKNLIIYSKESETPTIASLIGQKNISIDRISEGKEMLTLNKDIFNILEYKKILKDNKALLKNYVVLIPLILLIGTSLLFLCGFLWRKINSIVIN